MTVPAARRQLEGLAQTLERLEEALATSETETLAIDGTIHRFESVFELCWRAMKSLIELNTPSIEANSARATIKAAFAAGWIDDEAAWLDLLDMRNATSHTYREAVARDVYQRIKLRTPMIRGSIAKLNAQLP
jgi:nucleotidyltransferase substrate binding protein (TIGR01987 family)